MKLNLLKWCPVFFTVLFYACHTSTEPLRVFYAYEWMVSSPEENGLNPLLLNAASNSAEATDFVNSLLVIKNNKLVLESYFRGFDRYTAFNIKSVSKSFISALVGIAVRDKYITSVFDQSMISFFPEYRTLNPDARIDEIRLVHLLTMQAGFDYDDRYANQFFASENWIKSTIELPLIHDPGSVWNYATPLTHLLSVILTRATEMSTLDFARIYLFEPLGVEIKHWVRDPQGYYFGGSEMYFTSRDLARFGFLYLNNGRIDNNQILPGSWVDRSLQDYTEKVNWSWGAFTDIGYGYLWWLGTLNSYRVFFALGYGGQYIVVVPDFNMIIVVTCNAAIWDYDVADSHEQWVSHLISEFIIAAASNGKYHHN